MIALAVSLLLAAQPVEAQAVDDAVQKGLAFLRSAGGARLKFHSGHSMVQPLRMLTFAKCGVEPDAWPLQKAVIDNLTFPVETTYDAGILAMAWEQVDRVKYQKEIARCAQFLIDGQSEDGTWSYCVKEFMPPPEFVQTPLPVPDGATATAEDGKPRVVNRIVLQRRRTGPGSGDNSNSQYAALGLRAAHDAGIVIPEEIVRKAAQAWRLRLFEDAPVPGKKKPKPAVATGKPAGKTLPAGRVAGWGYAPKIRPDDSPYESMTAGGIAALVIYDYLQKKDWTKDPDLDTAMRWMNLHFPVGPMRGANPPYSLYAVERAGVLYGTEYFGDIEWYPIGARALLALQSPDGSWKEPRLEFSNSEVNTCFALLFLKRTTRPLQVPTAK